MLLQKQINVPIAIEFCIQHVFCIPEDVLTKHLPVFHSKQVGRCTGHEANA